MSLWGAVLLACVLSFAVKLAGYLVPESLMAGERTQRVTTLLPVALLAALVVVQTVTGDAGSLVVDARLVAVAAAVVLLLLRANFLAADLARLRECCGSKDVVRTVVKRGYALDLDLADPEDQVRFLLLTRTAREVKEALSGTAPHRLHRAFARTATGQRLLRERPDIVANTAS